MVCWLSACDPGRSPETVSEEFLFRYFIELNQAGALELCTGLAEKKLRQEMELLQSVRMLPDLDLAKHKPFIDYELQSTKNGPGEAVNFHYDVTIENQAGSTTQSEIVLTAVPREGKWRITNFDTYTK
jgi:hypothetical protein